MTKLANNSTLYAVSQQVLATPVIVYTPKEIKLIRKLMGKSPADFAELFGLSKDLIEAWEAKEGTAKHREPSPLACKTLYWCAVYVNGSAACHNNKIRLAAKYGPDFLEELYFPKTK